MQLILFVHAHVCAHTIWGPVVGINVSLDGALPVVQSLSLSLELIY